MSDQGIEARLREAEAIILECESPDGFCGEMPDDLRDRIEESNQEAACACAPEGPNAKDCIENGCRGMRPQSDDGLEAAVQTAVDAFERAEGQTQYVNLQMEAALKAALPALTKYIQDQFIERLEGEGAVEAVARHMQFRYEAADGEGGERLWSDLPAHVRAAWHDDARGAVRKLIHHAREVEG